MSKLIKAPLAGGGFAWIISPNTTLAKYAFKYRREQNFLEFFYFFGQTLLINQKHGMAKEKERRIFQLKRRLLIELDGKVTSLKYYSKEIARKEKNIISKNRSKKRVSEYSSYQILLGMIEGYLNIIHSIGDLIAETDDALNAKFGHEIKLEEWYKIDIDLRNIFHHNQSPILDVEDDSITFGFDRLPRKPLYFTEEMRNANGFFQVTLESSDLHTNMIDFLNKWAKKYLDLVDPNETIEVILSFHKDGRPRMKKITVKELINVA